MNNEFSSYISIYFWDGFLIVRMSTQPTLKGAQVSFHTLGVADSNKDRDSHVTVTVRTRGSGIAARIDDDFGEFEPNSENGPYELDIINEVTKDRLSPGGNVTIRLDPNG